MRRLIKQAAERFDFDIRRLSRTPGPSLAGIGLMPIRTVLDVGANEGQFAHRALRLFPTADVYCFEPLPSVFAKLQSWAAAEKLSKVLPLQLALGSIDKSASMFVHLDHDPSSSLLRTTERARDLYAQTVNQSQISVEVRKLDSLVFDGTVRLSADNLLKLDVQGYELEVLDGARTTLESIQASIVEIGVQPLYEGQGSFIAVTERMAQAGLRYVGNAAQVCDPQGRVVYVDAAFVRGSF